MTASSASAPLAKIASPTLSSPSNDAATVTVPNARLYTTAQSTTDNAELLANTVPPNNMQSSTSTMPTLSTMDEIGRFCNPMTAKSTAIVCNSLLWTVLLELLENAKARAFDDGKKEGYYEGYEEGSYLASENKENDVFEVLRKEDEEKVGSTTLEEGREEGYEKGLREGEE